MRIFKIVKDTSKHHLPIDTVVKIIHVLKCNDEDAYMCQTESGDIVYLTKEEINMEEEKSDK